MRILAGAYGKPYRGPDCGCRLFRQRLGQKNIYGGPTSVDAAVGGRLVSASHCANIMSTTFREPGAACATNNSVGYRNSRTQDFATLR